MIRTATVADIASLLALEEACFNADRISRRSFQHLLTAANALTFIEHEQDQVRGYITLLFRQNTRQARIYSIATAAAYRQQGVARALLQAAEQAAQEDGCSCMRLEIRLDNPASLQFFQSHGYRIFGQYQAYYADQMAAARLQKSLPPPPAQQSVPYYRQTLGFTCGASCLMMAMKAFDTSLELNRTLELQLWREATTIFMTAGHGGCGPFGLALAAQRRAFRCEIYVNGHGVLFQDSVRSQEKREVIQLVHEDFVKQAVQCAIPTHYKLASANELLRGLRQGGIPLVLISTYRLTRKRAPHWVVITACDEQYFYIHDPDMPSGTEHENNLPILKTEFERIARYGRDGTTAVVMLYPPLAQTPSQAIAA